MSNDLELGKVVRSIAIVGISQSVLYGAFAAEPLISSASVLLGTIISLVNVLWLGTLVEVLIFPERRTVLRLMLSAAKPIGTIVCVVVILSKYRTNIVPLLVGFFSFVPGVLVLALRQLTFEETPLVEESPPGQDDLPWQS